MISRENEVNDLGQPIGFPVRGWTPPSLPPREPMTGRFCFLEPLCEVHAADLWEAYSQDEARAGWTYLADGPFEDAQSLTTWLRSCETRSDAIFFAIVDARNQRAVGIASYLRMFPNDGTIEVGNLHFSPLMQRTPVSTEAMYLMMRRVFELGYRRYEWKCNALNEPSRRAATRLGFTFEGVFRQALVVKGRNRDTAWFSVLDSEWPDLKQAFEDWLAPSNFDGNDRQLTPLAAFRRPA